VRIFLKDHSSNSEVVNLPQTALRRPLTVIVMVRQCASGDTGLAANAKDIFPISIIPTIYVTQAYGGMDPAQMEGYYGLFF